MNASADAAQSTQEMRNPNIVGRLRGFLTSRRGLILLGIAMVAAAVVFNWGWLAAAGIAPLILAFAPCAAMCALGLCMSRMGDKSCATKAASGAQDADQQSACKALKPIVRGSAE